MNPKPTLMAELIAEFLGTFVLILFGTGVVAMVVLFPRESGRDHSRRLHQHHLGWGLAVTMGIYVAGKISGHIESRRDPGPRRLSRFPWRKVLPYSSRRPPELSRRPLSSTGIICQRFTTPIRNWNAPPEYLRHFPLSPRCRRRAFSISSSAPACWCF